MYVHQLSLTDFRSYREVELELAPGVTAFIGPNGQGKTNLVEAVQYLASHRSHRVATDQALVRHGADRALIRAVLRRAAGGRSVPGSAEREVRLELEINPGQSNRARLNRSPVPRPREVLGVARSVLFAPEDLVIVKGDPSERRRFLDELLVARLPRMAAIRSDYDRVLKQRNTLLKTASARFRGRPDDAALSTLDVWDRHLATAGAELVTARLDLVAALARPVAEHYHRVAETVDKPAGGNDATISYQSSIGPAVASLGPSALDTAQPDGLAEQILAALAERRSEELERGLTLVGPHRDELLLELGPLPVRGYASHGEAWSFALALKLAAFDVLRDGDDDPVLILDDVFAELDDHRRARLSELVGQAEQVLITAAVAADVPEMMISERFDVREGKVLRA
jgi:DNA replication and repair protein RecF